MRERPSIVGPLILITIGVLFLLSNLGYLSGSLWLVAAQFWPVILILFGIEILIGGRSLARQLAVLVISVVVLGGVVVLALNPTPLSSGAGSQTVTVTEPAEGVASARVTLSPAVGDLTVRPLEQDSPNLVEAVVTYPSTLVLRQSYTVSDGAAQLVLDTEGGPTFIVGAVERWNVDLSSKVPLQLNAEVAVGGADLDLNALNVTQLNLKAGVGGLEVVMPSHAGSVAANVDSGVGGVTVLIPQGVAARIRVETGLGGASVNEARFPRVGEDLYSSPDYATAADKIDLFVKAGVGGISIP